MEEACVSGNEGMGARCRQNWPAVNGWLSEIAIGVQVLVEFWAGNGQKLKGVAERLQHENPRLTQSDWGEGGKQAGEGGSSG